MFIAKMILSIYGAGCRLLSPIVPAYLRRRVVAGKESQSRLQERFGQSHLPRPTGPLIWCHGASVGESLSILPILDRMHQARPDITILMTTGTLTSANLMDQRLPEGAIHQFVPLDHPVWTQKFLSHWQPDCILWLESEFWPNLLSQAMQQQAPAILINGRMSAKSFARWQKFPALMQHILAGFDLCLTQEQAYCAHFTALGAKNVDYVGNLKFASAPLPVKQTDLSALQTDLAGRVCWVAASTHPGEEAEIIRAHRIVQKTWPDALCILVPRHPHRGADIGREIAEAGLSYVRRSQNQPLTRDTDIYLADSLGELGLFYRLASIAFVGGSLVAHGGHNPLEPALLENAVLYGPHMDNFQAIDHLLKADQACLTVSSGEELGQTITDLFDNPETCQYYQQQAAKTVQAAQNGVQSAVWQKILSFLPPQK